MKLKYIVLVIMLLSVTSCRQKEEPAQSSTAPVQSNAASMPSGTIHTGVVDEVLQATSYTYLHAKQGDTSFWAAITKRDLQPGVTVSFSNAMEMNNFTSKDLSRTFDAIYFVDQISIQTGASPMSQSDSDPHRMKPNLEKMDISVEPAEGGITLTELYANRENYENQPVTIRGKVTKVNRAILDRNWFHIQDGTGDDEHFDLTITTKDDAQVGDIVTFKGTITLDKDFGAGYQYDVIMEDAVRLTE